TLHLVSGAPVVAESELWIEYRDSTNTAYDPDLETDAGSAALLPCETRLRVLSFTELAPPTDDVSMAWWSVTLDEFGEASCMWAPPQGLHLGVGVLDASLAPALDLAGLGGPDEPLYGLYAQFGTTSPVWVFGVIGTSAQYAGTAVPPDSPPLPDGDYALTTLHLLPYSAQ